MNPKYYHWWTFTICWLTGMCAGMEANLFSVLVMPVMNAVAHTSDKVALSQLGSYTLSSFLIGWAVGGIAIGTASDCFGRVRTMAFAVLLFSLFSGIAACAQTPLQIAACRFMIGLGVGGAMVNMSVLLAECWPSRTRAIAVGSLLTSYQAGVFASGMIIHFIPEWRAAFAAAASPAALAAVIWFCLKEQPKIAAKNVGAHGVQDMRSLVIGCVLFGSLLVAYWASASWIPTWIQDLTGASTGLEKSSATMWHGVAAVAGCMVAGPLVTFFGRVRTTAFAFLLALVITVNMLWMYEEFSAWVYVNYALLGFSIGMAQAALYIYLPELFSSSTRGRNVGICLNAGRFFTAIAVLFVGTLVPLLGGYSQGILLFSGAYLFGIGAALVSRETAYQKLPQ